MQLRGKLTAQEIKEVGNALRSKWYWPRLLLRSFYGLVLVGALVWGTISKIVSKDWHNWQALAGFWLIVAIILTYAIYRTRSSTRNELRLLNARLPDSIIVDQDSVRTWHENGKSSSQPWSTFTGWRENRSVYLLDMADVQGFMMLPTADLTHIEFEQLSQLIRLHLGDPRS